MVIKILVIAVAQISCLKIDGVFSLKTKQKLKYK